MQRHIPSVESLKLYKNAIALATQAKQSEGKTLSVSSIYAELKERQQEALQQKQIIAFRPRSL